MNRFICLRLWRIIIFLLVFIIPLKNLGATTPGVDDYKCNIGYLLYSDDAGRVINTDFSTDTYTTILSGDPPQEAPAIIFSSTSVINRPASEFATEYKMFSYIPSHPDGTLHLSDGICLIGVKDSSQPYEGRGAVIPLNFGEEDSLETQLEVQFMNFRNITQNQYLYLFDVNMGSNVPSVECMVGGGWFNGTYKGQALENVLVIFALIKNSQTGEKVESDLIIKEGLNYLDTSVTLKMQITNNGYTLMGSYRIDDGSWENIQQINSNWQITGYTGSGDGLWNVPGIDFGIKGLVIDAADSDHDGVINELDQCPDTPSNTSVNQQGCLASDINGDGKTGLEEAIHALQVLSGVKSGNNGACLSDSDQGILGTLDIDSISVNCVIQCMGDGDPLCLKNCISTNTGLSDPCSICYADIMQCVVANCMTPCIDPESTACIDCKVDSGCTSAFETCSGL